jgi:WD40 repeat protein
MKALSCLSASTLPTLFLAVGCGSDTGVIDPATSSNGVEAARARQYSDWSAPVNLGPTVNWPTGTDNSPELSKDGLSLYFGSIRPTGLGSTDIYVSQRETVDDAWGPPMNLGPVINTIRIDGGPNVSRDGHWLYLISDRPGGKGSNDIYLSWRNDKHDDLAWTTPVNLDAPINTDWLEAGPNPWGKEFYFHRGPVPTPPNPQTADIYLSRMRGNVFGEPVLVEELSSPGFFTQRPSISSDGREMFFSSNRPGSIQGDVWTSTREDKRSPWSAPMNLGTTVNSNLQEQTPMISDDGTMLFFSSNRPRPPATACGAPPLSPCDFDLYVATRIAEPKE